MSGTWTTSAGELLLALDPSVPRKGVQLRLALRQAIGDGVLPPGTRLPSSRTLSADLGIARGVVVEAYEQLAAEGWVTTRRGSGTVVASHPSVVRRRPAPAHEEIAELDLRPARPDVASFPRSAWSAASRAVLADLPHHDLGYGDHRGHVRAREALAAYLARVRGVRATPDALLMTDGFSAGLTTVVSGLVSIGVSTIAVEDPGGYEPRRRVLAAGAEVAPVPVDRDGLRVDALERSGAGAVLLTPAHQYPMGHVLGPERRAALVEWARRTGGWLLEDDYDAEFRYDRGPIGALQGLAPERTIYLGSVAKTLAPAVRVGWLVAPEELVTTLTWTREVRGSQLSTLEHLVVAELVADGRYDRHLRRVRRVYRERRDVLLDALAEVGLDEWAEGVAAGLHAVVRLDDAVDDTAVVARIRELGVEVVALSRYAVQAPARGIVIGFGQASPADLRRGVEIIADVVAARGRWTVAGAGGTDQGGDRSVRRGAAATEEDER
jgi:GntR family transcriptional regulator/MocR family aminotransferase